MSLESVGVTSKIKLDCNFLTYALIVQRKLAKLNRLWRMCSEDMHSDFPLDLEADNSES